MTKDETTRPGSVRRGGRSGDTQGQQEQDGQVSEAGSGALNQETSEGGADSVPSTPDTSAGDESFEGDHPGTTQHGTTEHGAD